MYLNERSWDAVQDDPYIAREALKDFLDLYAELVWKYRREGIYVPKGTEMQLRSAVYPLAKWMNDICKDDLRRFLSFWEKRIVYIPEDEIEFWYEGARLEAAAEAVLNDSFVISLCLDECWKTKELRGRFFILADDSEQQLSVTNVYCRDDLQLQEIQEVIQQEQELQILSYKDLWDRREKLFPNLSFCPSVEKELQKLQGAYIKQIIRKLKELDCYCKKYAGQPFDKNRLSKTTPESEATMQKYRQEHLFKDENDQVYLANWHMRFTGIPGRIFFVPNYTEDTILICHIGDKLPNVKYG